MRRKMLAAALAALPFAVQAAPPPKPKLILAIAVDQFSSEVFKRYRGSYADGLKTLSHGIAYPAGYQSHAATETCPGHSTILTGRHPSGTGIVSNNWLDLKTGANIYCAAPPGQTDPDARGPQNMRVTTLGDWIKAAEPGARSFAVSGKDRAAIMMAGQNADGVYWWVDGKGFQTSRFAAEADPKEIGRVKKFDRKLMARWKARPPTLWPKPSSACAALQQPHRFGQMDISGAVPPEMALGVTAGDMFLQSKAFHDALRASPLLDEATVDFAIQLIQREWLGRGPATDIVSVSLSATDYVGHRFGNGGAEMCVQQAALDATIGRLIAKVRAAGVPVMVVLTADHGATDAAEREHDHDGTAARLDSRGFVGKLNKALKSDFAIEAEPIIGDDPQQLVIAVGLDPVLAAKVQRAAVDWLKQQPEVSAVYSRAEIEAATVPAGTPPDRLTMQQRFNESYDRDRSGDIAVVYAEHTSFGVPRRMGDTVAGHGSPWDHDRQVPILFWWPQAAAETRDQPVETVDIAPTLAAVAGIRPPVPVDGRCLDLGGECQH
ncbi:alkaline phosphatase family protein [Rhizorhabdus argentea]|uniref:alkaline phosphatase family protein n=1 Tax=Rhizorhabdus argentea TaxID=1387174 RepID=UPI0030EB38B5